jgi:uncharacterized membrane protein
MHQSVALSSLSLLLILFGSIILLHNYTRPTWNVEKTLEQFDHLFNTRNDHAADEFLIFLTYHVGCFGLSFERRVE